MDVLRTNLASKLAEFRVYSLVRLPGYINKALNILIQSLDALRLLRSSKCLLSTLDSISDFVSLIDFALSLNQGSVTFLKVTECRPGRIVYGIWYWQACQIETKEWMTSGHSPEETLTDSCSLINSLLTSSFAALVSSTFCEAVSSGTHDISMDQHCGHWCTAA